MDKVEALGYIDKRSQKFRVFDPLHIPNVEATDCILHISSYLEESSEREFNVLRENVGLLSSQVIFPEYDYRIDLILSINGHVEKPKYIKYLKSIDGSKINSGVYVTVFQRQNMGFQWGGFHDVWLRYKDVKCDWFATMEADCYFLREDWLAYLTGTMKEQPPTIGYFGHRNPRNGGKFIVQSCDQNTINPLCFDSVPSIPTEVWRDGNNKVIQDAKDVDTCHSGGGFHFCRRSFLEHMDKVFGCFTFSMGCHHDFDGIVLGEVGFGQKTRVLGYSWLCPEAVLIGVRPQ